MPCKEAIKLRAESDSITPIEKSKYKVVNWDVYNKSLKNRRKLSLYFPKSNFGTQFINDASYSKGRLVERHYTLVHIWYYRLKDLPRYTSLTLLLFIISFGLPSVRTLPSYIT